MAGNKTSISVTRRSALVTIGSAAGAALLHRPSYAADRLKVAGVYSVPVDQQWASRLHIALKAAEARGDIEYSWSESVANTDMERTIRDWSEKKMHLVIADTFAIERNARKVAADYLKTAFLMGSSFGPTDPNYSVFDNFIQDASYLTGIIAGGMSKSGTIGMVGGYPIPEVNRLMNAFMDGVHEVNPKAKFFVSFIGSWFDPPKAKEAAYAQIERGADLLYAERFGVSDAAKEKGVLTIGNLVNTQPQYPNTVVASALWHMEPTIDKVIAKLKDGAYKAEDYGSLSMMKFGGASLSPLGTFEGKVPSEIMAKVADREKAIRDGSFVVKVNDGEPKSTV
jgi:basic membrane lipoprotein Med (substrate-binding protein (PBP1-ABC) superfamily)